VQPKSGYKTITPIELCNVLYLLDEGKLSKKSLQVYFACFSLVAIREAAKRSLSKNPKKGMFVPSYRLKELSRATMLSESAIKKELKTLESLDLLRFAESEIKISKIPITGSEELLLTLSCNRSSKRPIPIPRSILRFLSKCEKISTVKTLLAYILRGLTLSRTGEITGKGSVKSSWISDEMSLSLRSVKSARKELIELGIVTADTNSHQCKLNRTGAYFTINLDWTDYKKEESVIGQNKHDNITYPQKMTDNAVDNLFLSESEFAPLPTKKEQVFAPPYKDKKTSSKEEYKYQKPLNASRLKPSGVFTKQVGEEKPPTIKNIIFDDFKSFFRTEELYTQAVKAGWITDSENNFLNWVAAAVRAKTLTEGDPVRVFVGIVRKKLFAHITLAEEERAQAAIKKFRYGADLVSEEVMRLVA
jgi:hypothetical protein